jgi:putative FmdB family regulatory protein
MPIYEYQCNSCNFRFERRQGFHDKPVARCPKCQGKARRVIHPAPVIFKGKGFYSTDSRKGGAEPLETPKKTPGEGKPK